MFEFSKQEYLRICDEAMLNEEYCKLLEMKSSLLILTAFSCISCFCATSIRQEKYMEKDAIRFCIVMCDQCLYCQIPVFLDVSNDCLHQRLPCVKGAVSAAD